jgi:hypothetical protein
MIGAQRSVQLLEPPRFSGLYAEADRDSERFLHLGERLHCSGQPGACRYDRRHHRGQVNRCPMKVTQSTADLQRLAADVEDGADDPQQALMEVSHSQARDPQDSPVAPSYLEQRAAVHQAAGEATAGDADPDGFPRYRARGEGRDHPGDACQQKEIGTDLRARTKLTTHLITGTG